MSKILVTGAHGQLGNELKVLSNDAPHLWSWVDLPELDITDAEAVQEKLEAGGYDFVINCAAYTAVDKAESEPALARAVNREGVTNLAAAAARTGACVIHISTDFVFDGKADQPIPVDAPTNPLSVYGETKQEGEQTLINSGADYYIVRTSWLYSSFGGNFVKTMLRLAGERDRLNVVKDQVGSPTYARDLAQALMLLVKKHHEGALPAKKIYHYSNDGVASWYEFAKAIFEMANKEMTVTPIPTSDYPTPATRPAYSVMDTSAIQKDLGLTIPAWRDSLKACLSLLVE